MGNKKHINNVISEFDNVLEIDISTPKYPDAIMLVNKSTWNWYRSLLGGRVFAAGGRKTLYAKCKINDKVVFFHRVVLPTDIIIDHIDGNGLNNTISNLREATNKQNIANSGKRINNNSGFKGVHLTRDGKFVARHCRNYLGRFDTAEDAHNIYNEQAKLEYGEFAYLNK